MVATPELGRDVADRPRAVAQVEDLGGRVVEEDSALGVEQHAPLSHGIEVESCEAPECGTKRRRERRHARSSRYALWIVSIITHSTSSLNASASNARRCVSTVVQCVFTISSPCMTSRGACTRRLWKYAYASGRIH